MIGPVFLGVVWCCWRDEPGDFLSKRPCGAFIVDRKSRSGVIMVIAIMNVLQKTKSRLEDKGIRLEIDLSRV